MAHLDRRPSVPNQRLGSDGQEAVEESDVAWLRTEVRRWLERRGLTQPR